MAVIQFRQLANHDLRGTSTGREEKNVTAENIIFAIARYMDKVGK